MDIWSIIIIAIIATSGIVMIIGPIVELRGTFFFLSPRTTPKTKRRYGLFLMALGLIVFILGLIARSISTSLLITPVVLSGFALWFIAGIIALARNETLTILTPPDPDDRDDAE